MKKNIFLSVIMLLATMFVTSCNKDGWVEKINQEDAKYMAENYANDDYQWLECCIDFVDFLDEDNGHEVASVANIYKIVTAVDSANFVEKVVLIAHTRDTMVTEERYGIWVGDNRMDTFAPFKVNLEKALSQMYKANCPKPHSRHCVIRKEVGPKDCNPQYIFGNKQCQVYVDVVTGSVSSTNPVFDGFDVNDTIMVDTLDVNDTIIEDTVTTTDTIPVFGYIVPED